MDRLKPNPAFPTHLILVHPILSGVTVSLMETITGITEVEMRDARLELKHRQRI